MPGKKNTQNKTKGNNLSKQEKPLVFVQGKDPISIRLVPEDKKQFTLKEKRVVYSATIGVVTLLVFVLFLFFYNFIYRDTAKPQNVFPNTRFVYNSPKYILKGEQNVIDLTVINISPTQAFNGTIIIIFADPNIPISPLPDQNLSVVIKDLHPNDRATGQIKFTLPENSNVDEISYYFQVFKLDGTPYISVNNTTYKSVQSKFKVFPIPYIKTITLTILGSVGILTTIITSWDEIKKFFGLSKS